MKLLRQTYKKPHHFKLKPVVAIVLLLAIHQVYAQPLTLAQAEAQDKQLKHCIDNASGSRAKAQCKTNALQ